MYLISDRRFQLRLCPKTETINMRFLLFNIACLLTLLFTSVSQAAESRIITVETVQDRSQVVVGGTVIPYKEVTLSAQIPGRIDMIAGEEGDRFQAGDLLASIDEDDLRARRRSAVAKLRNAQYALRNAQIQYDRELRSPTTDSIQELPGMGVPSLFDKMFTRQAGDAAGFGDPDVERGANIYGRWTSVNQAAAQVEQARSTIAEIDAALRDARSIAPFDGVIMDKLIERGDTVQPGQPMLRFAHVDYLRIRADIPTRLINNLEVGMIVRAFLDVAGRSPVDARVAQIYPQADPQRHTVTVKFDLPAGVPGGPGMYADIVLPVQARGGPAQVVVPHSAILEGSLPSVLKVTDGTSQLRVVRLGREVGPDRVAVMSGLSPGDRIVDNPPPGASSGYMP